MKRNVFIIIAISFLMAACGAKKELKEGAAIKNANTRKVLKAYNKAEPDFETLHARLQGSFKNDDEKKSITMTMRIKKDETIWISAKFAGLITVGKLLVTPDRVQFYEKINKRYFDGDFSLLSHWFGMDLDFEKFQNLLLGKSIYEMKKNDFELEILDDAYLLSSKDNWDIEKSVTMDKMDFSLKEQALKQVQGEREVTVNYPSHKKQNDYLYPERIGILISENDSPTEINLRYRSLDIDESVKFPFNLPSEGYKEISVQ